MIDDTEKPFTLEEAKEWLHKLEDDTWSARSRSGALEFILANLLIELHSAKVIDSLVFIERLLPLISLLESPHQISAKLILDDLHRMISSGGTNGYVLH